MDFQKFIVTIKFDLKLTDSPLGHLVVRLHPALSYRLGNYFFNFNQQIQLIPRKGFKQSDAVKRYCRNRFENVYICFNPLLINVSI